METEVKPETKPEETKIPEVKPAMTIETSSAGDAITGTTKEFASRMKQEYLPTSQFLNFLVGLGLASITGKIPSPTGRGKPSNIYQIPSTMMLEFKLAAYRD